MKTISVCVPCKLKTINLREIYGDDLEMLEMMEAIDNIPHHYIFSVNVILDNQD